MRGTTSAENFPTKRKFYDAKGENLMTSKTLSAVAIALAAGLLVSCSTGSATKDERDRLLKQAQISRQEWNKVDPQSEEFAKKGQAFVFFPAITKGGLIAGRSNGHGA